MWWTGGAGRRWGWRRQDAGQRQGQGLGVVQGVFQIIQGIKVNGGVAPQRAHDVLGDAMDVNQPDMAGCTTQGMGHRQSLLGGILVQGDNDAFGGGDVAFQQML